MLRGEVVAVELHEGRARELEENLRRLGAANVRVVHADALSLPPELTGFDRALVDAPCSGLGVLAQRPDLRWRAKPLPELQLALLRAAAERVRPGGTILYAVCTINADENEGLVDASGLEVDASLADEWPAYRHPRRPEFLLTLPHRHGTSGFFVARLRTPPQSRNPKAPVVRSNTPTPPRYLKERYLPHTAVSLSGPVSSPARNSPERPSGKPTRGSVHSTTRAPRRGAAAGAPA